MNKTPKTIMIGLGYIGLPTAAVMARQKMPVTGVDISEDVVNTINQGKIHIVEPDLDILVKKVVTEGYLKAKTQPEEADVFLIAVPTPFKGDHQPDLAYVEAATKSLIPFLKEGNLVIIESTSPVGTTKKMQQLIDSSRADLVGKYHMAYCPERVLPGNVIYELEHNDRAIGGIDEISTKKAKEFYSLFVKGELHATNSQTAEMTKLTENASRDVQIAFANELSLIADKANIDVWELIRLANKHPRVNILQPGTGVGGHCIAVDPWFIVSEFPKEARIIRTAREINNYKTEWVIEKIKNAALQFEVDNKRKPIIACMGIAFKPNIDDLRESPALYVTQSLVFQKFEVIVVEPNIKTSKDFDLRNIEEALEEADIIAYLVSHREFSKVKTNKMVLDFVNV